MKPLLIFIFLLMSSQLHAQLENNDHQKDLMTSSQARETSSVVHICVLRSDEEFESVTRQVLDPDTRQWTNEYRCEHEYDAEGNLISDVSTSWDPENRNWKPIWREQASYGMNGVNNITYYLGNRNTGLWDIFVSVNFVYDEKGHLIQRTEYSVPYDSNELEERIRKEWEYNEEAQLVTEMYFTWDRENKVWNQWSRHEYEYDETGNRVLFNVYEGSDEVNLLLMHQHRFIYEDGLMVEKLTLRYDPTEGQLENRYLSEYHYTNRLLSHEYDYHWDRDSNQWFLSAERESDYDEKGRITRWVSTHHNPLQEIPSGSLWEYTYDDYGNTRGKVSYYWFESPGRRVPSTKHNYLYDSLGTLLMEEAYFFVDTWLLTERADHQYDETGKKSMILYTHQNGQYRDVFNKPVGEFVLGTEDVKFSVFPNPASDIIYFTLDNDHGPFSIEIFDFRGQRILSSETFNGVADLSHFKSGTYLYLLRNDNGYWSGIIIKR